MKNWKSHNTSETHFYDSTTAHLLLFSVLESKIRIRPAVATANKLPLSGFREIQVTELTNFNFRMTCSLKNNKYNK